MNLVKIMAVMKFLFDHRAEIVEFLSELASLIETLIANQHLIGSGLIMAHPAVNTESAAQAYPSLSSAIAESGSSWKEFVELLIENLDTLKQLATIIQDLLKALGR
jgi:hypothetical protein